MLLQPRLRGINAPGGAIDKSADEEVIDACGVGGDGPFDCGGAELLCAEV